MQNLITMDLYKDEMIETLTRLLRIESVLSEPEPNRPYGKGPFDALMFMMSTAEDMDLDCVNLFGHLGYIDYGEGDDIVAVLTHIDVVPAGEGWTYPPFDGTIVDDKIYGRGSIDDKGPAIASLFALKALSDNGVILKKKVRLIFGCDEESNWSDMEYYKTHNTLPSVAFSPDANYPVINAEKGVLHLSLTKTIEKSEGDGITLQSFTCGKRPNIVPNHAECVLAGDLTKVQQAAEAFNQGKEYTVTVESTDAGILVSANGLASHGSMPEDGHNAAASLVLFLNSLPLAAGSAKDTLSFLAETIGQNYNGEGTALELADEVSGKLTLNIGVINISDSDVEVVLDIRYPVSFAEQDVKDKVESIFASTFDIEVKHAIRAIHIPEDSELVKSLKEAYTEATGEDAYCIAIGGATYARAFDNAVSFGALFPGEEHVEHGPDEYIRIDTLMKCSQITANAIMKLAGAE
ncbi:MAG: dipeptidase PepV [Eubacteriales bacterium]